MASVGTPAEVWDYHDRRHGGFGRPGPLLDKCGRVLVEAADAMSEEEQRERGVEGGLVYDRGIIRYARGEVRHF